MTSEMVRPIDDVVVEDFPYPIALVYHRLLETTDKAEQAELCLQTFHFSIRAIAFAVIIQYLQQPPDLINDKPLNDQIREWLKVFRAQKWVELLQAALHAYRNHPTTFFMPELYDLYWDRSSGEPVKRDGPWEVLNELARLSNSIQDKQLNGAAVADKLVEKLREVLEHFRFIQHYELWYVRRVEGESLRVEVWRGQEKAIRNFRSEDIKMPALNAIRRDHFYICDQQMRLLELHPLIVSETVIRHIEHGDSDTGVYQEFVDKDTAKVEDDELIYWMLQANRADDPVGGELVALFRELYKHRLEEKQRAFRSTLPLNTDNLKLACQRYSQEQSRTAREKYIDVAYVEREALNVVLATFMSAHQRALVIAGNVGVGKTNLLLRYSQTELAVRPQVWTLWLDGARLDTRKSLAQTILSTWDWTVIFESLPTDEETANRLLRELLDKYLSGGPLVLLIDGVNENDQPMEAFGRINDFISEFKGIDQVKLIITTRPQVWEYSCSHYLRGKYKAYQYFHELPEGLKGSGVKVENDSIVLGRYQREELQEAFERYAAYYRLVEPKLETLSTSLRQAIQEPLLLRLTCEAFQGERIPSDLQADQIIDRLVASALRPDDSRFLQEWIVPQFVPEDDEAVAKLTRAKLRKVKVSESRTLDDLVSDSTEYADRTPVNARVQRLLDTGWLVRTGGWDSYELRFRYEYFYDYFVGKHLYQRYTESADKSRYFKRLVDQLNRAPFLWGALRNLLVDLLKQGEYELVERLGYTTHILQAELLINTLKSHYPQYTTSFKPILSRWLTTSENTLASYITVNVAIEHQIEDILKHILKHSNEKVRFLLVQDIHRLWSAPGGHRTTTNLLQGLSIELSFWKPHKSIGLLDILIRCSGLLAMRDYSIVGAKTETLPVILELWKPIIRKIFLVSKNQYIERAMKPIRRKIIRLLIGRITKMIRKMEDSTRGFVFSFRDLQASFRTDNEQRRLIFDKLMPHIDAAVGTAPGGPEELLDYVQELARQGYTDYLTLVLILMVVDAHSINNPDQTAHALQRTFDIIFTLYPPTEDLEHPTAGVWASLLLAFPLLIGGSGTNSRIAAETLVKFNLNRERLYYNIYKLPSGKIARHNTVGDILLGYQYNMPELGIEILRQYLTLYLARNDSEQICGVAQAIIEGAVTVQLPSAATQSIYDELTILESFKYFDNLSKNAKQYNEFWKALIEAMLLLSKNYAPYVQFFVEKCDEQGILPHEVKLRLSNTNEEENFDFILGNSMITTAIEALKSEHSLFRESIKWGFYKAMDVQDVETWLLEIVVYISNLIYGEDLFSK